MTAAAAAGIAGSGALAVTTCDLGSGAAAAAAPPTVAFCDLVASPPPAGQVDPASAPLAAPSLDPPTSEAAAAAAAARASSLRRPPASRRGSTDGGDPLDPLRRHRSAWQAPELVSPPLRAAPALPAAASASPSAVPSVPMSLEELLPALVRRIAWSGDGKRAAVRLEIGAGELAGATLLVAADAGRVNVHLEVPPGVDTAAWQARIRRRLESKSIAADAIEVS